MVGQPLVLKGKSPAGRAERRLAPYFLMKRSSFP